LAVLKINIRHDCFDLPQPLVAGGMTMMMLTCGWVGPVAAGAATLMTLMPGGLAPVAAGGIAMMMLTGGWVGPVAAGATTLMTLMPGGLAPVAAGGMTMMMLIGDSGMLGPIGPAGDMFGKLSPPLCLAMTCCINVSNSCASCSNNSGENSKLLKELEFWIGFMPDTTNLIASALSRKLNIAFWKC
jgi:hypothetical protein